MRVFLDTNVLVAAFATRGLCADLRRTVLAEHELLSSATVSQELTRTLVERLARQPVGKARPWKIRLNVEGRSITATLADDETARDFASLLPLELTLTDYASTEKISDLPRRLSTEGAPPGIDPSAGDLTYYAPWGNLAAFYKDGHYSTGLVKLGRVDSGLESLRRAGSLRVTVELVRK